MKKLHSGIDAWRYIIQFDSHRDSLESYLPLILSAAGCLGVLPFAVIRFLHGEWVAAIIDSIIVVGFVILGAHIYITRQVRFASIAISLFCITGVLSTMYLVGPHQIYWVYPTIVAVFYLLRPKEAIALVFISMLLLAPALSESIDTHATTTVVATTLVMSAFGLAFSLVNNRQREQLVRMATIDPLTGAGNRRRLDDKLSEVLQSFRRNGTTASVLMLDLDHFKQVNDVHGHAVGDNTLKALAKIVNMRIRITDSLYRVGGEEFVVVLEGANVEQAEHLAEQLRTLVEANELVPDQSVTISIGVAELQPDETVIAWLDRADGALYEAKRNGRNATSVAR